MASDMSTKAQVNFNLLVDVEPGDVIKIHFTAESIGDVAYLAGMLKSGIFTSPDEIVLAAIMMSGDWGNNANRYITLTITNTFENGGFDWFKGRMDRRIDKLEIVSRVRPLVDISVLGYPSHSIRFRFSPNGVGGVAALLELDEMGLVELGYTVILKEALKAGEWSGRNRDGYLISRLSSDDTEYREYFITQVVPHLEFLRP